jgi:ABC-type nitrate/sulfonate/bicarbonate transport system permease component
MSSFRHPRSMTEAFGPYTDNRLHPMQSQPTCTERVLGVVLAVVLGITAACWLLHELAKGY